MPPTPQPQPLTDTPALSAQRWGMRWVKLLLGVGLSLWLLYWLWQHRAWWDFAALLARIRPWQLLGASALLWLSYVVRAARMHAELQGASAASPVRYGMCWRIMVQHNALVNVLPLRSGEAALPLLLKKRLGIALPRGIASLLWLRLQDMVVVAFVGLAFWPQLGYGWRWGGMMLLALACFLLYAYARSFARQHAQAAVPGQAVHGLQKWWLALAQATSHAPIGWLWSAANWIIKIGVQAGLFALLLGLNWQLGASGAFGAELAAFSPVQGVAGIGTYEAGAAAALATQGTPFAAGVQAALLVHMVVLANALMAAVVAWLYDASTRRGQPQMQDNMPP